MPSGRNRIVMLLVGYEGGGRLTILSTLLKHFPPHRRPDLAVLSDGPVVRHAQELGYAVTFLGRRRPMVIHRPGRWRAARVVLGSVMNALWLLHRAWRLGWYLRRRRAVVVYTLAGHAVVVAMLAKSLVRVRIACHWHGVGTGQTGMRRFGKRLTRKVDRFIAISQAVKQSFPPSWQQKTRVVRNSIEVDALAESAARNAGVLRRLIGAGPSTPLVVSLASYDRLKGHHYLVEAMKRIAERRRDVVCAFLGRAAGAESRAYLDELRARAGALGVADRCRFLLDVPDAAAKQVGADVAVCTTWGPGEGFGLAMAEAMACGVPVVAFDAGAAGEVVADGKTGLLVPDADSDALADAVLQLLSDPRRAKAMGQAGRARAKELFDVPRVAEEVAAVLEELAAPPG